MSIGSSFRGRPTPDSGRTLSFNSVERTKEPTPEPETGEPHTLIDTPGGSPNPGIAQESYYTAPSSRTPVPTIRISLPRRQTPYPESYGAGSLDVAASSRYSPSIVSSDDSSSYTSSSSSGSEDSYVASPQRATPNPQAIQPRHPPIIRERRIVTDSMIRSRPELWDDTLTGSQGLQRGISSPFPRGDPGYGSSNMMGGSSTRARGALTLNCESYKIRTKFYKKCVVQTERDSRGLTHDVVWDEGREIGRGAAGVVYCQRQRETNELRAVKSIHAPKEGLPPELSALVELSRDDQFFVKFLGWYLDERSVYMYLITEYMKDGDLGAYIRNNTTLARGNAKAITAQILGGLRILHSRDIYHRDIKPQNILIARLDPIWVKIADFGVSKKAYNTTLKTNWGTECYRPPELTGAVRKPVGVKFRHSALDIWPLGALLHELLTGRTPFLICDSTGVTEEVSGFASESRDEPRIDMPFFMSYCDGKTELPVSLLQECRVNNYGIKFLKALLNPNPNQRPTADEALGLLSSTEDGWVLPFPLHVPGPQRQKLSYLYNIHNDLVDSALRPSRKLVKEKGSAESNFTYIIDKADTIPAVRSFETLNYSDASSIHTPSSCVTSSSDSFAKATFSSRIREEGNRMIIDFRRVPEEERHVYGSVRGKAAVR